MEDSIEQKAEIHSGEKIGIFECHLHRNDNES